MKNNKSFKWIISINLLLLVAYTILLGVSNSQHSGPNGIGWIIGMTFLLCCHVIANIFLSMVYFGLSKSDLAKSFLLSAGIVLLIGFSTCLALTK